MILSTSVIANWSVAAGPAGLSVNKSHNLLVACYGSNKIQEYSTTGSLVREISDSDNLWQAIELKDGTLVVVRLGSMHGVCVLTVDGKVLHSYGNLGGSRQEQMNAPRSLAVDK